MRHQLLLASVLLVAAACGDNEAPPAPPTCAELGCTSALCNRKGDCSCDGVGCLREAPDAANACTPPSYGSDQCCSLWPDEGAVTACLGALAPYGTCGDAVCELPDCSSKHIAFCGTGSAS